MTSASEISDISKFKVRKLDVPAPKSASQGSQSSLVPCKRKVKTKISLAKYNQKQKK